MFPGGESLMAQAQVAVVGIYNELQKQNNLLDPMTFETNGTQKIKTTVCRVGKAIDTEIFFSCSPKLFTVSGEN